MKLTFNAANEEDTVLVLGMFDGVHMGHRHLIEHACHIREETGYRVIVMTFNRHPLAVLNPKKAPQMLSTLSERVRAMAHLKVDTLCVRRFTHETVSMSPQMFLLDLVNDFKPKHIVIGFNYTFGKGGVGDGAFLAANQERFGYKVHIIPPVKWDDETISSSRIRRLLLSGQTMLANTLLTRAYSIAGIVEKGKGMGHQMGFATANLSFPCNKVIPRFGVYASVLRCENKLYPSVTNVGRHPTLPEGHQTIEVHVLDGEVDLYNKKVRVSFLSFLRNEMKFESKEALIDQVQRDKQQASSFFDNLTT